MAWYGWIVLVVILSGPAWLWSLLNREENGPYHCIGCGECVAAGECTLKKKYRKKTGEKPRDLS